MRPLDRIRAWWHARCERGRARTRMLEAYWEDSGEFVDPDMGLTHGLEY
jgi:hypothetical protein